MRVPGPELLLLALPLAASCSRSASAADDPAAKSAPARVEIATVERSAVPAVVKLPGRLSALQEVSLYPKVNGYVKIIPVDVGSIVGAGTVLMVLEAPELAQAALQAKERFSRATAEYSASREHLARLSQAAETRGAVSPLDLTTARSKVTADSALANAERANWDMQQTMLEYLRVTAPFSGVITARNVHPGALVSASARDQPMLELKDESRLRLQIEVPEELAGQLRQRDSVTFVVSAFPGRRMAGRIVRRSRNISERMRAELTEVDVDNQDHELSPGMYAEVVLYTQGNGSALSVPASAVITSTERKYVLLVKDGKTAMLDVVTGNAANGRVEVYGALAAGDRVISNASAEMPEGQTIK